MKRPLKFRVRYADTWCFIDLAEGLTEFGFIAYMECVKNGERFYQYTGLQDCKENPIYEGDILGLTGDRGKVYPQPPVAWNLSGNHFYDDEQGGFIVAPCGYGLPEDWQQMEVIGNIYEHPHLLKGDQP